VTQSRFPRPFRSSLFWPARTPQVPPFRVGSRGTLSKKTTFPGSPAPWGWELHSLDCLGIVSNFNARRGFFAKTPNFHAIGLGFTSMKRGKVPFFDFPCQNSKETENFSKAVMLVPVFYFFTIRNRMIGLISGRRVTLHCFSGNASTSFGRACAETDNWIG
jgi:hypothetical protein